MCYYSHYILLDSNTIDIIKNELFKSCREAKRERSFNFILNKYRFYKELTGGVKRWACLASGRQNCKGYLKSEGRNNALIWIVDQHIITKQLGDQVVNQNMLSHSLKTKTSENSHTFKINTNSNVNFEIFSLHKLGVYYSTIFRTYLTGIIQSHQFSPILLFCLLNEIHLEDKIRIY